MRDAIVAMRQAFMHLAKGSAVMPQRTVIPVEEHKGAMFWMPVYNSDPPALGLKIVSWFPENSQKKLANSYGVVFLVDPETGQPQALLDGTYLTALRTGATSGLATDLLARSDASSVAIIGSGAQAYTQLQAVQCVRKINQIWIYSRSRKNAENFAKNIRETCSAQIRLADSVSEATKQADIICTATPSDSPLVDIDDVKKGAHINAIGSHSATMRELTFALLQHALIVVDQRSAALKEAGEIIDGIGNGLKEEELLELAQIIQQPRYLRKNSEQITVFKSVGLAIQDLSAAQNAFAKAVKTSQGVSVEI